MDALSTNPSQKNENFVILLYILHQNVDQHSVDKRILRYHLNFRKNAFVCKNLKGTIALSGNINVQITLILLLLAR